jgi:hypothetical protein
VVKLRLRRDCMPCKQPRRDGLCDESKSAALELSSKVRSVRAVADNKSPDTDARGAPYNLRRRRGRSD